MDLETFNSLLKIGVFVGGICAVGALITETIISSRQASVIRQLTKDTSDAKTLQVEAETRLKTVEGETAKQQERAANAEKALLELKEGLQPRTLSAAQRSLFIAALSGQPKSTNLRVLTASDDREASDFARQIADALKDAGWKADLVASSGRLLGTGIEVQHGEAGMQPHVLALQGAFKAAGLEFSQGIDRILGSAEAQIVVAHKP